MKFSTIIRSRTAVVSTALILVVFSYCKTPLNQFPGAGITQFNLAGTPLAESKLIQAVPNPNGFTTLPDISKIINVTIQ
jgi:hypothetical protein